MNALRSILTSRKGVALCVGLAIGTIAAIGVVLSMATGRSTFPEAWGNLKIIGSWEFGLLAVYIAGTAHEDAAQKSQPRAPVTSATIAGDAAGSGAPPDPAS